MIIMNNIVFGPVPSRRFGRSLGVDPVPGKTCNYSCVYCQLGKTSHPASERREYISTDKIVEAVREGVERINGNIDFITFMGRGEPTLASNLEEVVKAIRFFWRGRIALITNGSLFNVPEVRNAAMWFDVVAPTVAAGDEKTYRRIHHPARNCSLALTIKSLRTFRKEFNGEIWAEVMLVRDVNDSLSSINAIKNVLKEINPDKVHITTPIRPPSEGDILPPTEESFALAMDVLKGAVDLSNPEGSFLPEGSIQHLLDVAANHPLREDQAITILSPMPVSEAKTMLNRLVAEGILEKLEHENITFYRTLAR